jgi:threonine dehydratase
MTATLDVVLPDVVSARTRLIKHLPPTPLEHAPDLGKNIYLKLENTNKTHSFKIRGALNAVLSLDSAARERGIIAASSGNHAQGVAYAAHLAGVSARLLMPEHTPQKKVNGVRRYGAEVILFGADYDETEAEALRRADEQNLTYISPYNDPHVIAGAGTTGLEIVNQLPDVERVVVCVSGGGLIAGVATAIKGCLPDAEIIGVNAESAPAMYNAFYQADKPHNPDTLAEALSGDIEAGSITVPMTRDLVDEMVLVNESQIAAAMRWCVDVQGWLVEGGGAVGVAALLHGAVPADDRLTAVIVSGGNIDTDTLRRVLANQIT